MKNKNILILACAIPLIDITWELMYQIGVKLRFKSLLLQYGHLNAVIGHNSDIIHNLQHSLSHTLSHLLVDHIIYFTCFILIFLMISARLREKAISISSYVLKYFPSFFGVSSLEMLILQSQCIILRYFESR